MKILFLSDDFPPQSFGGAGIMAFRLADVLRKKGNEVIIITTVQDKNKQGVEFYKDLKVYRIYANYHERWRAYLSLCNPQTIKRVRDIINKEKPAVVHAHNIHYFLSYYCLKIAKKSGAKVFLTAHDVMLFHYGKLTEVIDVGNFNIPEKVNYRITPWQQIQKYKKRYNPFRNIIIRHYLKNADKVFAVSQSLKHALNDNNINNIEVIYNGVDLDNWKIKDEDIVNFKNKYNLNDKKIILFGGRLSSAKGGEKIVTALREVVKKIPNSVLLILGNKDNYAKRIEDIATEFNVNKNIIFTGWISGQEHKAAFFSSDVVVTPSVYPDPFNLIYYQLFWR